jgi:serine/threonine protein phosphatase PrpC
MANDNGGEDNISVVVVKVCASFRPPEEVGPNSGHGSIKDEEGDGKADT